MVKIFVTGGAGYIGSHVVKALGSNGYTVLTYDNLVTGRRDAVVYGDLVQGDLLDKESLYRVMVDFCPDAVVHCAASVVVPESVTQPLKYYINNVQGSLNLLSTMKEIGVRKIIFSSTAAVYGEPKVVPVPESAPLIPINPYGQSKAMVEKILADLSCAGLIDYIALRYFNVAGADPDGIIGEFRENATHLVTLCMRAAVRLRPHISIFGTDYLTPDGTCVRDYIHVEDLASAHLVALEYLLKGGKSEVYNCGYGSGYSVLEVIETVKKVTGVDFPVKYEGRREGDPAILVADSRKLRTQLGWKPRYDHIQEIVFSAWEWEQKRLYKEKTAAEQQAS